MNSYLFTRLKSRNRLVFFVGVGLIVALFLGNGYKLSWAAPEQNSRMQTVPPRPTDDSPPISPTPTRAPQSTTSPQNEDNNEASEPDRDNNEDARPDEDNNEASEPDRDNNEDARSDENDNEASEPNGNDNESLSAEGSQPKSEPVEQDKSPALSSKQGNKSDLIPVTPQQADLSLIKMVDNPTPEIGKAITLTTVVDNSGPSRVTNVVIRDSLPPGLVFSSVSASRGSYAPEAGLWTINTIGQSKRVTMSLVARVVELFPLTVTAEVLTVDQFDPDSTPNNNLEIEDDQASLSITPSGETPLVATQKSNHSTGFETAPLATLETLGPPQSGDWLYWLGAIIGGIVFIFIGVQLVHRS